MGTSSLGRTPIMEDSDIIQFMRNDEQPALTAKEIAAHFDVSRSAVNKRLNDLEERGKVVKKQVGAAAVVWWPYRENVDEARSRPD